MSTDTGSMQAISRAATILKELGTVPEGRTLSQLVESSGLPRSTAHRILRALETEGLVARKQGRSGYMIGAEAATLIGAARHRLIDWCAPLLDDLAAKLNETVDLYAYADGKVMCVHQSVSQPYLAPTRVGSAVPAHGTAAGKAVMAMLDNDAAERLAHNLVPLTASTVQDPDQLWAQVEQCRRTGVAWDRGEYQLGISSMAVTLMSDAGEALAMSVSVPSDRFETTVAEMLPAALETRDELLGALESSATQSAHIGRPTRNPPGNNAR